MKTKYIIIILLVLFILVNIFINKDTFISFNKSVGFDKTLTPTNLENHKIFKNIFNINNEIYKKNNIDTKNQIDEADILEQEPKLTFYSYEKCPKLYKLFKGLSSKEDNQIENVDGLRFRNKIRSAFYNIDRTIKIEHPILNLERKLMPVTIEENINDKLLINLNNNNNLFGTGKNNISISKYSDYIENDYSEVDNYQKLIDDCNLIFLYLENRIPKKMSENFIRLKDILEEEKEKVKKIKDIDPKALFLKDLEDLSNLPDKPEYMKDININGNIEYYETAQTFCDSARDAREAAEAETAQTAEEIEAAQEEAKTQLQTAIGKLNFNEQEQEYLIKIQNRIIDYEDYNYSKLVNDIITIESLDQKKKKKKYAK